MEQSYYKSKIGNIEIFCQDNTVVSLRLVKDYKPYTDDSDFMKNVKTQLKEYFLGKRQRFDIKVKPHGSQFQQKVWNELLKIPYGKTKSYIEIAEAIGNKNSARAVGNACNKNPIMIIIPCHRVISKSGKLSGFACGVDVKETLLHIESILE